MVSHRWQARYPAPWRREGFIFHLLGILFFTIWIVIGAVLFVGLFFVFTMKPWQAISSMMGNLGSVGNVAEVVKKLQSNGGDAAATFNSLPKTQIE